MCNSIGVNGGLSVPQIEALAIMSEECGEIVLAIGKINRHGLRSYHPDNPHETNRDHLAKECGDALAAIEILIENGILLPQEVRRAARSKLRRINRWVHVASIPDTLATTLLLPGA